MHDAQQHWLSFNQMEIANQMKIKQPTKKHVMNLANKMKIKQPDEILQPYEN